MISAALTAMVLSSVTLQTSGLEPAQEVRDVVNDSWASLERTFTEAVGHAPSAPRLKVLIERAHLGPGRAGASRAGVISLRQANAGVVSPAEKVALRHELAHQFLLLTCAAATGDALFHEAFALATSGEAASWRDGDYQSMSESAKALAATKSLDTVNARRALARLLAETTPRDGALPTVLRPRLIACDGHLAWPTLTLETLAQLPGGGAPGVLVMSRHSGEVLWSRGDIETPRPFGSTLKPFVLAGAVRAPELPPRVKDAQWACGDGLAAPMSGSQAVLRSCNGYFLDWAQASPGVERFGAWGPVLRALGLERLPSDMSEAIGVRTTLSLSPLALAAAYRLLAEARPDVLEVMKRNWREGTLAGLPESQKFQSVATKTGTVRDGAVRVMVGWLVGVTDDLVMVQVQPEHAPREFAAAFIDELGRARAVAGRDAVEVQVFGLLDASAVSLRCARAGFSLQDGAPTAMSSDFAAFKASHAVCLGAPFEVRLAGTAARPYAGVFRRDAPAPYVPSPGVTEGQRRARQGSEVVFRTTRLSYVSGVLAAEDSAIAGEARAALARVISHNVDTRERHGSRPVCDTTHCQAFKGSVAAGAGDVLALSHEPIQTAGWLPFSRGGSEPWKETRPADQVQRALGFAWSSLVAEGATLKVTRTVMVDGAPFEQVDDVPCERLRGPLKLPSCPRSAVQQGGVVAFDGVGRGHGLGLDVELAKKSGLHQDELVRQAFEPRDSVESRRRN